MIEPRSDLQAAEAGPAWRAYPGKRVIVYAMAGGYAARCAPATLREAESAAEAIEKLLQPPDAPPGSPVAIYVSDPVLALPPGRPDGDGMYLATAGSEQGPHTPSEAGETIVRVVSPEAPGEPIALSLTLVLARRWFGARALQARSFLAGVAGVVAARAGLGPTIEEANGWVRAELAARRPVSILAQPAPMAQEMASGAMPAQIDRAATSFVAFLLETAGAAAVRQFLAGYDPDRRDQAALGAFQRPLGTLEEAWLSGLQRRKGEGAFRTFFRQVLPLLRPYWRRELEVLAYMLFGLSYGLVLPLSGKYLIDTVIPSGSIGQLSVFILVLAVIYVLNLVVGARRAYVNNWINQQVLIGMQERMFAKLQRLSHSFFAEAKVGDLIARFSNDLLLVQQALGQVVGVGVYLALSAVAASVTLLVLSPLLGILVLVVVPLFVVAYRVLGSRLEAASFERQKRTGEAVAALQENLTAYSVIRAFGLEARAIASYHALMMALLRAMLRLVVIGALFETSTALATTLGQLVVLGVGGTLVIKGHLTVGTLLAFIGLLPALFTPVSLLSTVGQTVQGAAGSLNRIEEVLNEPIGIEDKPDATTLPPLAHEIRLDHVTFGYGGDRPILRDLDLGFPAGTHVAIVGPSGSGKSTVINLLLRFWDPELGRVLYDGHDLREVTLATLRGQIGIVFQDTFVFNTTVRENIALSRPGATDAEVVAAARAAQLDSYVGALPAGYDTVLGERGVKMSGGQRQRLAIARALLRDPRILILDEATSALDAQTEREILETLAVLARGRTTISITHRLSLAAMADRIVVLEGGQVVEQGTHAELVGAGGLYQRLYEEQTGYATGLLRPAAGVEIARLRTIPLFADLSAEGLAALADRLMLERYAAGEDVVRQGEQGDRLYIVSRGTLEVVVGEGEGEQRVNTLMEGDYFGEMALLAGEPRVATVRTAMPAELYSLAQKDFLELEDSAPAIRQGVADTVAKRQAVLAAVAATAGGGASALSS